MGVCFDVILIRRCLDKWQGLHGPFYHIAHLKETYFIVQEGFYHHLVCCIQNTRKVTTFCHGIVRKCQITEAIGIDSDGLIDEGKIVLKEAKDGSGILPTAYNLDGSFAKQFRLKEVDLSPDMLQSLQHLQTQVAIASVLEEIKGLKESIQSLQIDLQNDRLAIADSAWDKWAQAHMIPRGRARNDYLRLAMATATDAKCTLMRNFAQRSLALGVAAGSKTGAVEKARKVKLTITGENERLATEAMQDLVSIANMVRIECEGHVELNQYDAAEQSLVQFTDFVHAQQLDNPDTLLSINSYLANEAGGEAVIDQFQELVSSTATWKQEAIASGIVPQIESVTVSDEDEVVTSEEIHENQEA